MRYILYTYLLFLDVEATIFNAHAKIFNALYSAYSLVYVVEAEIFNATSFKDSTFYWTFLKL